MLDVFAEFATNLLRERQLAGIAAATVGGVYEERKQAIAAAEVR
jgi:DNA invertase Pin-like site-specific DNA recombinase